MPFFLARYIWREDKGEEPVWDLPPETGSSVDLRPRPAQARRGGPPEGFLICQTPIAPPGALLLGGLLTDIPDTREIEQRLDLKAGDLSGVGNVMDALEAILGPLGDPSGANGPRPCTPNSRGRMRLCFGGQVRERRFDRAAHPWVFDMYRAAAQLLKARCEQFPADHKDRWLYRRHLTVIEQKTGFRPDEVIPGEIGLPRRTAYSDSFTEASSTALTSHTPDVGTGWTQHNGAGYNVSGSGYSNQGRQTGTGSDFPGAAQMASDDLDSDDMVVSIDQTSQPSVDERFTAPYTRFDRSGGTGAENGYHGQAKEGSSVARIYKRVDGASNIIFTTTWTPAWPNTVTLTSDGDGHTLEVSTEAGPYDEQTDTTFSASGFLKHGFASHRFSSDGNFDNYSAEDIAVGEILANMAVAEATDTLSAEGDVLIEADATVTEGTDTLSASVESIENVHATITEGADTLSGSAVVPINATATVTEGTDTITASVTVSGAAADRGDIDFIRLKRRYYRQLQRELDRQIEEEPLEIPEEPEPETTIQEAYVPPPQAGFRAAPFFPLSSRLPPMVRAFRQAHPGATPEELKSKAAFEAMAEQAMLADDEEAVALLLLAA